MALEVQQSTQYRTPSIREAYIGENVAVEHLARSQEIQRLTTQCLYPFTTSVPQVQGEPAGDNKMKVHKDGQKPYNPTDGTHRDAFFNEAFTLVATYCQDFFDGEGHLKPEQQQNWFNVVELAPDLLRAITDRHDTEKRPYITMVQEQYALNILSLGLHLIQNPDADLLIRMGIGGSDNDFTTARLAAYGLPAVSIAEAIQDVYAKREATKLGQRAVERLMDREHPELDQREKRAAGKQLMATIDPYDELTPEEIAEYRRLYAIRTSPVRIEFVFAPHAAEAVNSLDPKGMTAQKIDDRNEANRTALESYINTHHEGISGNVEYVYDTAWSDLTPFAKLQLEFFADLLQNADDPDIQGTLAFLQTRGGIRGGQIGQEKAAEYAAAHPALLGDRLYMPYTETYLSRSEPQPKEELLITIGGEPERHFNAVRQYLGANATPEALLVYIDRRILQAEGEGNTQEAGKYIHMAEQVTRWQRMLDAQRERYYSGGLAATPRTDLPIIQVPFICNIGETPVYYATEFDIAVGKPIDQHVEDLTNQVHALRGRRKALQRDGAREEVIREQSVAITTAERVLHDTSVLSRDMKRRKGVASPR